MFLSDPAATSAAVGATLSRLAKIELLAWLLLRLAPAEVPMAVAYLSGELPGGALGVGWAALGDPPRRPVPCRAPTRRQSRPPSPGSERRPARARRWPGAGRWPGWSCRCPPRVTRRVPEIVAAARACPASAFILDGELIALHNGRPRRFQETMGRFGTRTAPSPGGPAGRLALPGRDGPALWPHQRLPAGQVAPGSR